MLVYQSFWILLSFLFYRQSVHDLTAYYMLPLFNAITCHPWTQQSCPEVHASLRWHLQAPRSCSVYRTASTPQSALTSFGNQQHSKTQYVRYYVNMSTQWALFFIFWWVLWNDSSTHQCWSMTRVTSPLSVHLMSSKEYVYISVYPCEPLV